MALKRWGIVSTGNMAKQFVEDFQYSTGGVLQAVCSRQVDRGKEFAREFAIPMVFPSVAEMAASGAVDLIYIASPHSDHYGSAMQAIQAGVGVLCEKPLTLSLAETEALYLAASDANVFLMEGLWTRFNPAIVEMLAWIQAGRIGEIKSVHANFGFAVTVPDDHRLMNPALGGGALLDVGIYPLFLAQLVLGIPAEITSSVVFGSTGVDIHEDLKLEYANGAEALLTASFDRYFPNTAVISGTRGYIEIPSPWFAARSLRISEAGGEPDWVSFDVPGKGWHFEVTHVNECLQRGFTSSSLFTPQQSIELARTMDTIRQQWRSR